MNGFDKYGNRDGVNYDNHWEVGNCWAVVLVEKSSCLDQPCSLVSLSKEGMLYRVCTSKQLFMLVMRSLDPTLHAGCFLS